MKRWITVFVVGCAVFLSGQAHALIDIAPFLQELSTCKDPSRLRVLKWKMELIADEFPFSEQQARDQLMAAYPEASVDQMTVWLTNPHTPSVEIDGRRLFFSGVVKNIGFRHVALLRRVLQQKGAGSPFFDQLRDIVFAPETTTYPPRTWQPYTNPVTFVGEVSVRIPRSALPESGTIKLWVPLPVQTGSQVNPRLITAQPAEFVKTAARSVKKAIPTSWQKSSTSIF
ncbi:MAG: hypothetical protein ABIL58_02675 [Pseudomonadota bacterium]